MNGLRGDPADNLAKNKELSSSYGLLEQRWTVRRQCNCPVTNPNNVIKFKALFDIMK